MDNLQFDFGKIKSTRKKLKISLDDASTSCALSIQQIQSIEENKDAGFFNAHFKKISTLKYIKFLGLSPEDVSINIISETKSQNDILMTEDDLSTLKDSGVSKKFLVGVVSILLVIFFSFFFSNNDPNQINDENNPEIISDDTNINSEEVNVEVTPNETEQPLNDENVNQDSYEKKTDDKSDTDKILATAPSEQKVDEVHSTCPFEFLNQTANFKMYRTDRIPEKPDSFIHIVSTAAQKICFVDASEKPKEYDLSSAEKITIHGKPPYKLWLDPNQSKVYFQGWRVPLSAEHFFYSIDKYLDPNLTGGQ